MSGVPRPASWVLRLLAIACMVGGLGAADPAPRVDLSVTPAQVAVGETVTVTITYSWPRGWTVASEPDPSADFRDQFVTSAPPAERGRGGDDERRTIRYVVAATRSGAWLLPRPSFTASGPAGPVTARAPEVIVQVGTEAAPPKLPAPRPLFIRPPAALLPPDRTWWWIAGGAAVLLAGGAVWWWQRRRGGISGPTAWDLFQRELDRARQGGDGREVGTRISLALRRYAGAIGGFDGPGQTTREVGATLRRLPAGRILDDEGRDLLRLLERLDDLRWMAGELPADAMAELTTLAGAWAQTVERRRAAEAAAKAAAGRTEAAR